MKQKTPISTANLIKRYVLLVVLLPHSIYALMVHCPIDSLRLGLAILFFLPLSFYFLPAASLAGGHGFVCQIGCGPISPLGYTSAIVFWAAVAAALAAVHIKLRKQPDATKAQEWARQKLKATKEEISEPENALYPNGRARLGK
jgi:hypothetical protein